MRRLIQVKLCAPDRRHPLLLRGRRPIFLACRLFRSNILAGQKDERRFSSFSWFCRLKFLWGSPPWDADLQGGKGILGQYIKHHTKHRAHDSSLGVGRDCINLRCRPWMPRHRIDKLLTNSIGWGTSNIWSPLSPLVCRYSQRDTGSIYYLIQNITVGRTTQVK